MQTNVILFPNKPKTKEAVLTAPATPRLTDFTSFLPQGTQQILIELSSGTHNIPHKLYEFMFKATESKVELVVFACLVRFTMGFHRSKCRASQSYICEWTGLGSSGVRRGLKILIGKGLICVDKEASFEAMCSIYELPVVKWYLEFGCLDARKPAEPEKDPKKSYPQGNPPSTEGTENPCPKQAPPSCQNEQSKDQNGHGVEQDRQARPSNLDSKKETLNKDLNSDLNKEYETHTEGASLPKVLEDYFANIKLRTKRERELKHFQMLSKDYSHPDIADCLLYVQKYGLPGSGVRCHAPMGFLASSMDVVLLCVLEERKKEQQRRESERLADLRRTQEAEEKAAFEAKFNHIKHLFIEAFPSKEAREDQYEAFAELNPVHEKGSYALKSATVLHWFSQQQDQ